MDLSRYIRSIPDFPKPGVLFRDITPLLADADAFHEAIEAMAAEVQKNDPDVIVGIDARGFIFASAIAFKLNKGLVIARKKGKLPYKTMSVKYSLEYASHDLEMHEDAIVPGTRAVIVDDVLATGGTAKAAAALVEQLGGTVAGILFLIEVSGLGGRKELKNYNSRSLLIY